mgnify:CR=1 FL=1
MEYYVAKSYESFPRICDPYEINGKKLSNGGIASYRAYLNNVSVTQPFVISVPNLSGKCEVFINGECVFSNRNIRYKTKTEKSILYLRSSYQST